MSRRPTKSPRRKDSSTSEYFFEVSTRTTPQFLAPPGYISLEQLKARAAVGDKMHGSFNFKNLQDMIFIAVGSPEKVANLIGEWTRQDGHHHVNIQGHLGNMPNWKAVKNMTLFAEEVMPRLRGRGSAKSARSGGVRGAVMEGFQRKSYKVNGVETVVYEGGKGRSR